MNKTFRQKMREYEDIIISRNADISLLTSKLYREYERRGGGIPRTIVGFNRDDIYGEGILIHWRDEFGDGRCKRETFASKYQVD